jgi:hypothetical protein
MPIEIKQAILSTLAECGRDVAQAIWGSKRVRQALH